MSKNEQLLEQYWIFSKTRGAKIHTLVWCTDNVSVRRDFTPLTSAGSLQPVQMQNLFMSMRLVSEHSGTLGQVIISFNSMFFDQGL